MIHNQAVLVISGYNIRAVIAFCRWATAHHVQYHIVAQSSTDPIFATDYKDRVAVSRDSVNLCPAEFRSWIGELCDQHGYDRILVLPSTEFLNRFLVEHRDAIEAEDCVIPLVDKQLYETISDKQSFTALCDSYGLDIPEEFADIPEQLPFVAKPRVYSSANGKQRVPLLVHTPHDLERLCREEDTEEYFFQQFISGGSQYLLAYVGRNGNDVLFSQENLMQQAHGGSVVLAKGSDFHQSSIAGRYIEMLRGQEFFGLVMVEVRFEERHGPYYVIEANPRLWGPLQFAIDNGVDFFGAMLRDHGFDVSQPAAASRGASHYFWSGGITRASQPIAFHNYSAVEFVNEFSLLRPQDIFFRADTFDLFLEESKMELIRES